MPQRRRQTRNRRRKPFFVSLEGVDGSGKSTQIHLLKKHLKSLGFQVFTIREPGGTKLGEKIRHLLQYDSAHNSMAPAAETLLFCASRAQLVAEKILPALRAGKVILADRFMDSTAVYQGCGRRLGYRAVQPLNELAVGSCRPDLTIVLSMRPEASLRRARKKSRRFDRMERQKAGFYRLIDRGYRLLARSEPRRVKIVRADRPVSEVAADIRALVRRKLGARS